MIINVIYNDKSHGKVDDSNLDALISSDQIIAFRRSSGWVVIGRDPVRCKRTERRRVGCVFNTYV
jgi:hypothetical protein